MFLKRMETIGFKSFAERIRIEFMPGITAIVGPNGSGKSNVIDAIRWVLGEQSVRSLRGKKMEDVIFQGSDTRKPLNFAEVSLILNNENGYLPIDYQEVSITRRVYRTGESEFYINKQACRLKDIVDLFTDTGLGRESFSIIGQGKIDEILSSKADDRRAVFEEAAGVMKYKQRKQQATFKLAETEDNLSRVQDIMHEINQQLDPLKEQAATAREYNKLMNELQEKEISLLITEIEQLHDKWQSLLKTIEQEKIKEIEELTHIQKSESKLVEERETIQAFDEQLTALQQSLLETTELLQQAEGERTLRLEQIKHRKENKANLLHLNENIKNELTEVEAAIEIERSHHREIMTTIEQIEAKKKQLENKLFTTATTLEDEIENLKSDYIEWLNRQAVLQNEQSAVERQINQNEASIGKNRTDHRDVEEKYEQFMKQMSLIDENILSIKSDMTQKEQQIEQIEKKLRHDKQSVEQIEIKIQQNKEQLVKLTSRKEALIEMKENFQGFAYGVRQILQAKKQGILKNIEGAVIDLIQIPNELMTAMETILGHQAQYLVVPNEESARETIAWLKRENKGRATFLPLDVIAERHLPEHVYQIVKSNPGFIGIGSELVSIAPQYKRVIEHLMGNVIVTKTLKDANKIARMTNRKYRIVTIDGDVVFPGGSMSGGAQKKAGFSLFSREKELQQLIEQTDKAAKYLQKLTSDRNQLVQRNENNHSVLARLEAELSELKQLLEEKLTELKGLEITKVNLENELSTYHYYIEQYEEEQQQLFNKQKEIKLQLSDVQAKISETEKLIEEKTQEHQTLIENEKTYQNELHELELKYTEQAERRKNSVEKIKALEARLRSIKNEEQDIVKQLQAIEAEEEQNAGTIEIDERIKSLSMEKEKQQNEIELLRTKREKIQQWILDEEKELKAKQKLHDEFVRVIQQKEIEANRLDVMLDNRLTKLQSEYVITYEKAQATYDKVEDVNVANQEVKGLKKAIDALGAVNLGAIEEYDRLQERYTFLNEQKEDLLEAKQTLYDAISEMDEEMVIRFKGMFAKIHLAFTEVFKELFGGGHAELILTDPENYLETGIDIVARPPGKKLKTLELLSGGERALTAIALLFAILKARPVPFVILDEVDAALDEANVERFASYLKTFSKENQFIVISHRKGTMEEADALYGVTMQESGVSRFVSVKLEEADELINVP